ncbi:MAG: trypsin-like peptidase domain-containing protein, partial [Oscillospiraceae bacterium]|nr:trypsin-like peptidase domain-containing protein [Oscillospiraceae bacterium]
DNVTAGQYMIFLLRALGYDSDSDFEITDAVSFARKQGIECSLSLNDPMTRGKAALASYDALNTRLKGSSLTLLGFLTSTGVISADAAATYGVKNNSSLSAAEIYENCADAVFFIETYDKNGEQDSAASGFFISPDGVALTNYHVLELSHSAKVFLGDDEENGLDVTGVYKYNADEDWAVIQVAGKDFPCLELNTGNVRPGDWVCAIGNPLRLRHTMTDGIVSYIDRNVDGVTFLQMSAPTSNGSSGGALLDSSGRVVGITRGTFSESANLNLAVPIGNVDTSTADVKAVPVRDITPEPELYVIRDGSRINSLTLEPGENVVLQFYENLISNVTLTKYIDDYSIIQTYWGDWQDIHTATMEIYALSRGTTMMTVVMTYGDEELARVELEVTVI